MADVEPTNIRGFRRHLFRRVDRGRDKQISPASFNAAPSPAGSSGAAPRSAARAAIAPRTPIDALLGGSLADGTTVDVRIRDGVVTEVVPAATLRVDPGDTTLDVSGFLLLTAPGEPHAHLDKALTFDAIQPPFGDLRRAIDSFHRFSEHETVESIHDRARRTLQRMLINGTTAVRSHVNFSAGPDPMINIAALLQLRAEFADLVDLELVALPGWETPDAHIEAALDAGVDLIGGASHLAPDPTGDLHRLLDIAERRGIGVDLHADEGLDGPVTLGAYAARVRDWPVSKSAGHCVRLGTLQPADLAPVIEAVLAADIGIVSLPITNLYLQGWQTPVNPPRGLTALRPLLDAGVRVAAGADNVRDPFNPIGRCDALETAALLVVAGHLSLTESIAAVTDGARSVMHLPAAGPTVGAAAELLVIRAGTLGDAVAFASPDRYVIHRGRLVAESQLETSVASAVPNAAIPGAAVRRPAAAQDTAPQHLPEGMAIA